jgi:DNA-binding response OmpR family regulator
MLVEDNPGDARLVQEMLRKGYDPPIQLLHVTRLAEAIECLALQPYSAILLDLSLPDGHGLETVKRIGNAAPDVPIVVMSGLIDEEIAIASVQAGAQDYLVKGNADPDLLVRSIQYAIERHRMQRRLHAAQQALQQQAEREALVNRITNALNSNLDPQRVLDEIVRQTASP